MSTKISFTAAFKNTDSTRTYTFGGVEDSLIADTGATTVKNKIKAINASLAAGTSGGLDDFIRSDDYDVETDPETPVGQFASITSAKIVSELSEEIVIEGGEG